MSAGNKRSGTLLTVAVAAAVIILAAPGPIEDAPAVSPSTGQYEEPMKIEIKVPEGYTAYYTMDGSTPTTASTKYTGPINMPEKDTLFKAIIVNAGGRASGVTTRNYILDIPDEEE